MRHRVDTFKVGRSGAHRRSMLANMVSSLFANGRIETTVVKAKAAAPKKEEEVKVEANVSGELQSQAPETTEAKAE